MQVFRPFRLWSGQENCNWTQQQEEDEGASRATSALTGCVTTSQLVSLGTAVSPLS